jgi:hypothetical protein
MTNLGHIETMNQMRRRLESQILVNEALLNSGNQTLKAYSGVERRSVTRMSDESFLAALIEVMEV